MRLKGLGPGPQRTLLPQGCAILAAGICCVRIWADYGRLVMCKVHAQGDVNIVLALSCSEKSMTGQWDLVHAGVFKCVESINFNQAICTLANSGTMMRQIATVLFLLSAQRSERLPPKLWYDDIS